MDIDKSLALKGSEKRQYKIPQDYDLQTVQLDGSEGGRFTSGRAINQVHRFVCDHRQIIPD